MSFGTGIIARLSVRSLEVVIPPWYRSCHHAPHVHNAISHFFGQPLPLWSRVCDGVFRLQRVVEQRKCFHHTPEGTRLIRYDWFKALEPL